MANQQYSMHNINQGGYVPPGYPPVISQQPNSQQYGFQPPADHTYPPPTHGPYVGPQHPYAPVPTDQGQYAPQMPYSGNQPAPFGSGGYQPPQGGYAGGAPGDWMTMPVGIPNCPPGLEYLTTIDQLLVKQKVELLEAFTGFETNNKFSIKNSLGQKVYYAVEDTDCCTRNCCGPLRPFDMKVLDNYQNEVIHLYRKLACNSCCFPCCLQHMEVSSPPGTVVGTVEQEWSICSPQFSIKNHVGDTVLRIEGPVCTFSLCGDVEFKVVTMSGTQVGKISKQWSGFAREIFTDADFFGITFPMDLDVRMKATLLGACFLIDAMFFEKSGNKESDRPGLFDV
ncbi:phospholipid scramblase 2 isoform X2 [Condylostylus longicornis]|uniref:phospholipid scramblase 2 isoform X2 n=1 Tax=Condylostylus longicornis TaxID=2530218 RepID=UPI00244DDFC3|nr:phospholipid scramblase 2 isoform X2 [Condylostylus longicornis]